MVVEISDELHDRLKKQAKDERRPLSRIVREQLEQYLKKKEEKK
jgi:predicted transcriptional regulator